MAENKVDLDISSAFFGNPELREIPDGVVFNDEEEKNPVNVKMENAFNRNKPITEDDIGFVNINDPVKVTSSESEVNIEKSLGNRSTIKLGDLQIFAGERAKGNSAVDVIPRAGKSQVGIVTIGDNIEVTPEGVISIKVATKSTLGLVKAGDNIRIDADGTIHGVNSYVHPDTHPASMIVPDATHRFVTDAQINTWDNKANTTGTYTGLIVGSANKLTTARNIILAGGVTGSASFDGSDHCTINATVDPKKHTHTYDEITGVPTGTAPHTHPGTDIKLTGYSKAGSYTPVVASDNVNVAIGKLEKGLDTKADTSGTYVNMIVGKAKQLETVRNIGLSGDIIGSAGFNGTGDCTINAKIQNVSLPNLKTDGIISNKMVLVMPKGGQLSSGVTETGAIAIRLPEKYANAMVTFWIDVFGYNNQLSSTYFVGGYVNAGRNWAAPSVFQIAGNTAYNVRFCTRGSQAEICIGETDSSWMYPQIIVRDVHVGYISSSFVNLEDPWSITFVRDFSSVQATVKSKVYNSSEGSLVPNPIRDNSKYLRSDNTWQYIDAYTKNQTDNGFLKLKGQTTVEAINNTNFPNGCYDVRGTISEIAGGGGHYNLINYGQYDSNGKTQLIFPYVFDNLASEMYFRTSKNDGWRPGNWCRVWHSQNLDPSEYMKKGWSTQYCQPSNGMSTVPWNAETGLYEVADARHSELIFQMFNGTGAGSTPSAQLRFMYMNSGMWYRSSRDREGFEEDWARVWTSKEFNPDTKLNAWSYSGNYGLANGASGIIPGWGNELNFSSSGSPLYLNYRHTGNARITAFNFGDGGSDARGGNIFCGTLDARKVVTPNLDATLVKPGSSVSWIDAKIDHSTGTPAIIQNTWTGWNPLIKIKSQNGSFGIGTYSFSQQFNIVGFKDGTTANSPDAHFSMDLDGNTSINGAFSATRLSTTSGATIRGGMECGDITSTGSISTQGGVSAANISSRSYIELAGYRITIE